MKKLLTLLAVGSIAFGVVSAAAASLGASPSATTLSATNVDVSSCMTGTANTITVSYATAYDSTNKQYEVTDVTLTASSGDSADFSGCITGSATLRLVKAGPDIANSNLTMSNPTNNKNLNLAIADAARPNAKDVDVVALVVAK